MLVKGKNLVIPSSSFAAHHDPAHCWGCLQVWAGSGAADPALNWAESAPSSSTHHTALRQAASECVEMGDNSKIFPFQLSTQGFLLNPEEKSEFF